MSKPKIVKTTGICSGDARLNAHRIKVRDILYWLDVHKHSKEQVAKGLDITVEEIDVALEYYRTHKANIEAEERRADRVVAETEKRHPSKLQQKLEQLRTPTT